MKHALIILVLFTIGPLIAKDFVVPELIQNDVEFWGKVYSEWDSNQVVFYDEKTKIVYDILDLPPIEGQISSQKYQDNVDERFEKIKSALIIIEGQDQDLTYPEILTQVAKVVRKHSLSYQTDLSNRLKYQNGLRGQFEYGLKKSGRYEKDMRAMLKSQGLPESLLAIVFVESLFYIPAVSHAGAAGPWGILPETAKLLGIHVNDFADERRDPLLSTWAAAKFLKKAKEGLSEWPLAITAYNYGYPGMMRASKNLSTQDLAVIIENHDSPLFGYASKNYYAEFLAALNIWKNHDQYFPAVKMELPWQFDVVQVLRPADVSDLLSYNVVEKDDLCLLNPSFTKRTIEGDEVIPPNYSLRVKKGKSDFFYRQLKNVPRHERSKAGFKISTRYKTNGDETLVSIAQLHGIAPEFLGEKMGKPLGYQPKGVVVIRSQAHLFSQLKEFNKVVLAALTGQ